MCIECVGWYCGRTRDVLLHGLAGGSQGFGLAVMVWQQGVRDLTMDVLPVPGTADQHTTLPAGRVCKGCSMAGTFLICSA